ncbi:MAG: methionine--tRNA ligase [Nanoarchaeota archaeon]
MVEDDSKKILITSALPYVNNIPHLGNIIGSVLSADVFARYCRLKGKETLFVCGADEHGTATEAKAKEQGVTPKELCDTYYSLHKEIYDWFGISFDIFGRTSKENHHNITQELFRSVRENGFIKQDTVTQPFCKQCDSFLADRFILGTCPHCGYDDARGDQCDSCGKLLNPQELIEPKCKVDGTTPEFRETEHLFLELDKLQPYLEKWFEQASQKGCWTENSIRTTKAWFVEGLQKRAISRDLKWGIPIPHDGFEDKVFYVWFDAPIGYISITQQYTDDWKDWWFNPENVSLYQFMGKDNIPFHSIIFPATLIAAETSADTPIIRWDPKTVKHTMVHHLNATEYINYEHGKFSKSRGIGVFGDNAKDSGLPADVFRYVLLYNRPQSADTQFTWDGLQARLNNELVANLGNLVNRTMTFITKFFDGAIADVEEAHIDGKAREFLRVYRKELHEYDTLMQQLRFREAVYQMMKISSLGNQYFQESQPWKTRNDDPEKAKQDMFILANIVKDLAILSEPFMPDTSQSIYKQLGISMRQSEDAGELTLSNHTVGLPELLFEKLEDEQLSLLKETYSGQSQQHEQENDESGKQKRRGDVEATKQEKTPQDTLFKNLDMKVGKILDVTKHPKADKLYIEKVDVGDGNKIQIVSGLVPHYEKEELLGKHIIVVTNLKPAKLRGEWSNGMLLAADDGSDSKEGVGLILAPDSEPGTRIVANGVDSDPVEEVGFDQFMKISFELVEGTLLADGHGLCAADGTSLRADRLTNGKVR